MSDPIAEERRRLIRQVRQRLESLAAAGVAQLPIPMPPLPAVESAPAPRRVAAEPPRPPAPPAIEPTRPAPAPIVAPPAPAYPPRAASSLFGEEVIEGPVVPAEERAALLADMAKQVAVCRLCANLASSRTQTVFGEGNPRARLMFIGEAPGADEDATGRPFIGRAGQLLTDMITKGMGLKREDVYIANILKCRPPGNRDPQPDESGHCLPYLERQIAIIRPEFLCLLGRISASILLQTALPAGKLRGRWQRYKGIPTIVTWHPAYLLRNPAAKKESWEDLQLLMQAMGIKPPDRKRG